MTTNGEDVGIGLQEFVEHVEGLSTQGMDGADGFAREFSLLRQEQAVIKAELNRAAGLSSYNAMKNRYRDIIPYDHCRVILPPLGEDENEVGVDYINASVILDAQGRQAYIAAQGPLSHTTDDFWRMIWHTNAKIVVMACNIIEANRYKCSKYWPDVGDSDVFGVFHVKTESEEVICRDFTRRTLTVTYQKETRTISNYHFISWPDHGVPDSPESVMQLVQNFRQEHQGKSASLDSLPPIVVHCSAGCGRTGTIIALDSTLRSLNQYGLYSKIDVYNTVLQLRKQRIAMVQTREQMSFVYKAVLEVVKDMLSQFQNIPSKEELPESAYVNLSLMRQQLGNTSTQRQRALTVIGKRAADAESQVKTRRKEQRPADFDEDGVVDEEDEEKGGSSVQSSKPKSVKPYELPLDPPKSSRVKPNGPREFPQHWTWQKNFLTISE
eukprot:m.136065 g.136065  ORF g.136065 m.136065 type:complete len:439 (-) comp10401_c0_seq1:80-1396(-)